MVAVYIVIGLLVGGVVVGVIFYSELQKKNIALISLQKDFEQLTFKTEKTQQLEIESKRLEIENTRLQTRLQEQIDSMEREKRLTNEMRKEQENMLKTEFQNIANRILEDKSKSFADINKERLDTILSPFSMEIKQFKERMEVMYKDGVASNSSLKTELKNIEERSRQISEDALNLTHALKGDTKIQGDWGEMILERMLESVGLRSGLEYFKQTDFVDENNVHLRPDIIVRFPDKRDVIIDSKVSLTAYSNYMSTTDEQERNLYLKEHLRSVRKHIDELNKKDYSRVNKNSLDYVIMFVPNEASYMLALQQEQNLWNEALQKKVVLSSSTSLLGILYMIGNLWQRFRQEQNAQLIVEAANALYEKMVGFVDNFQRVGVQLQSAQKAFEDAQKQLKDGNGNLITRFEKMKKMGLSPKKSLPENLIQIDE